MIRWLVAASFLVCWLTTPVAAQQRLNLHHADKFEVLLQGDDDIVHVNGSVIFETDNGMIYCDSAVWVKGKRVRLRSSVRIDDEKYRVIADSVDYDLRTGEALALGSDVELFSKDDSLLAIGTHAWYNRNTRVAAMRQRPTVYIGYPDTANMIEVVADRFDHDGSRSRAEARGDVIITSKEFSSRSGCAVMNPKTRFVDLFDNPVATRNKSQISGKLISVYSVDRKISQIDVVDSAQGEFVEQVKGRDEEYDRSLLRGRRILFDFEQGELFRITCYGQAYSWYYPSARGEAETQENTASGDTIKLYVEDESLRRVEVIGGAVGSYIETKLIPGDTAKVKPDTIDYSAQRIDYAIKDSTFVLTRQSKLSSDQTELEAYRIQLDTRRRIVEAFSADVRLDSTTEGGIFTTRLQPNPVPVILKDKSENLYGDYLEYSIDTKKGRIVQSKSSYEQGIFYGRDVYRQKTDIIYLDDGRYTTCDADEPHFHFYSKKLKFIKDDKLIARPVILNIGRLPILAIPYYVFPLKKGRHSGLLPFTVGNIEQGDRYVRNIGYYWAASEHWDLQGAMDYYDRNSTINLYGRFNYATRYKYDGYISLNHSRSTDYSTRFAEQFPLTSWVISGAHNQTFSPTFRMSASGQYQSDASYYTRYSSSLDERLNRTIRSTVNISKSFGHGFSMAPVFSHEENLDTKSRTDILPSISFSVPTWKPFGSGRKGPDGQLEQHWYNNLTVRYTPAFRNYSTSSVTKTITVVDTLTSDTTSVRYSKKYSRLDHGLTPSLSLKIGPYINFIPSMTYSESWAYIYGTNVSDTTGIKSGSYRTNIYTVGASLSTKIYGTVSPNVLGITGFRQVLSPSISYAFVPRLDRHPKVRSYAGGNGSADQSQTVSFGLTQDYQARIKQGERDRTLNLVTISSNFGYNFEAEERPLSGLSTSMTSNVLPRVSLSGSMQHSFYRTGSNKAHLLSPSLESFSLNSSATFSGNHFLFDYDLPAKMPRGADSANDLVTKPKAGKGWSATMTYSYSESGHESRWRKQSFFRFSLRFYLTPNTQVEYSQYYDIERGRTINRQVNINRVIHCWTGNFFWVPVGSNRGYGFRLFVTALPSIKIDNSQSSLDLDYWQGVR